MTNYSTPRIRLGAFTLVEVLVAMSTLLVMLGFMGSILNHVFRTWETARRETEIAQNARAILGLLERDLAPATVSNLMQFGENPALSGNSPDNLPDETLVPQADALFFWRPTTTSGATVEQVGWFLSKPNNSNAKGHLYDLKRFSYPTTLPDIAMSGIPSGTPEKYWLPPINVGTGAESRTVSERVLGFWIECLDSECRTIPYLYVFDTAAIPLTFNSAARFQMAPPGQKFEDDSTFHYTTPATNQAHLLPASVRITILITDEATMLRFADQIPALPVPPGGASNQSPPPLEPALRAYRDELARRGIHTGLFSTTIHFHSVQNL